MIITDINLLKQPCKNVSLFDAQEIIKKLEIELKNSLTAGVGLAANQIGINAAVCILREQKPINLINPTITKRYDLMEFNHEGCLSFPGQSILTKRYAEIVVCDSVYAAGIILTGIEAVIAQHEIDHINGETMHQYEIVRPKVNELCWCGAKKYKKCHMGKIIK